MRHGVKGRHLSRTAEHRKALARNLVRALLEHGRIRTTDAKAREVRPLAERVITLGKRGDLHARRQALRIVGDGPVLSRLFGPIAERFAGRPGGYTRIIKAGRRHGDSAPVAYLELLEEPARGAPAGGSRSGAEEKAAKRGKPKPERKGGATAGGRARGAKASAGEAAPARGKKSRETEGEAESPPARRSGRRFKRPKEQGESG
jgi:large subunit ribosomal protein L17